MTRNGSGNQVATQAKENPITAQILKNITTAMNGGKLRLPAHYSAENALASAYIILHANGVMKQGQLTDLCNKESVTNALMDMVTQGLNPAKKQCYLIPYSKVLTCQRGYHGDMLLAKRVQPGIEFYWDTIREGETAVFGKVRTRKGFVTSLIEHEYPAERKSKIIGAYCGVFDSDGNELGCDVMTMERIDKSWSMSKNRNATSPHERFTDEMALRTVIRHRCKPIINSSNDEMLTAAVRRQDMDSVEAEVAMDASVYANQDVIDVTRPAAIEGTASGQADEIPPAETDAQEDDF